MRRIALSLVTLAAAAVASHHAVGAPEPIEVTFAGYVHQFDPGVAIGGETDRSGLVLSPSRRNREVTLPRIAYLDGTDAAIDLTPFEGRHCTVRGLLERDAISAGGVETVERHFDLLRVTDIAPAAAPKTQAAKFPGRLLADLEDRAVDFGTAGTQTPSGGLTPEGRLDNGRAVLQVALVVAPPGSADMFEDTAYVDRRGRRYWAVRTGGFAGVTQWVGPFPLPRPRR